MKKTLIFSNYDDLGNPYYSGGGARAIHEIAKRLVRDYHVTVLFGKYLGSRNQTIDGVKYMQVGSRYLVPKSASSPFSSCCRTTPHDSSLIYGSIALLPPSRLGLLPLLSPSPVIGLVHMLPGSDMRRKYWLPFDLLEKITLRLYTNFITTSRRLETMVRGANNHSMISVIPNGVDLPVKIKKSKKGKYILYLGRIEVDQKGLDLLIEAYHRIKDKVGLPLVIAGSGTLSELHKLKKLVTKFDLEESVELVGKIEGRDKDEIIRASHVVVVPSRFETFSLVSLEAMSYNTPLVTFDIDGLAWIPKSARIVASNVESKSLAVAITRSVKSSPKITRTVEFAAKFVKTMSWEISVRSYRQTIKKTLL